MSLPKALLSGRGSERKKKIFFFKNTIKKEKKKFGWLPFLGPLDYTRDILLYSLYYRVG